MQIWPKRDSIQYSRLTAASVALVVAACSPTEQTCSERSIGTVAGQVIGPMMQGVALGASGIEVRAIPQTADGCAARQTERTGALGTFTFSRLVVSVPYSIELTVPDSFVLSSDSTLHVVPRGAPPDTVNFKLLFAPRDTLPTLVVAARDTSCVIVAPQRCLLVRDPSETQYHYFYDSIAGFRYQPGYQYTIRVRRIRRPEVPADGSLYEWHLVEVVSTVPGVIWPGAQGTSVFQPAA